MDSDYSDDGGYSDPSSEAEGSIMDSDDDYAFDNAGAQFSSKSKVRRRHWSWRGAGACAVARGSWRAAVRRACMRAPRRHAVGGRRPRAARSRARLTPLPSAAPPPRRPAQAQYVILKRDDILARQHKAISEVTSILGLNEDEAARVLRKFKWCGTAQQGAGLGCTRTQQLVQSSRRAALGRTAASAAVRRAGLPAPWLGHGPLLTRPRLSLCLPPPKGHQPRA
jgi:hypothetical protein